MGASTRARENPTSIPRLGLNWFQKVPGALEASGAGGPTNTAWTRLRHNKDVALQGHGAPEPAQPCSSELLRRHRGQALGSRVLAPPAGRWPDGLTWPVRGHWKEPVKKPITVPPLPREGLGAQTERKVGREPAARRTPFKSRGDYEGRLLQAVSPH